MEVAIAPVSKSTSTPKTSNVRHTHSAPNALMKSALITVIALTLAIAFANDNLTAELVTIEKAPGSAFPTGTSFNAIAGNLSPGGFTLDEFTPTSLPDAMTMSAVGPTGSPASTASHMLMLGSDFSSSPAVFESSFMDFFRSEGLDQRATAEGHIEFKVDTFARYTIDGFFSVDDLGPDFGIVELEVLLLDITDGAFSPKLVFANYQKSDSTEDQTFFVGGTAGDAISDLDGSPIGILDPSKRYAYKFLVNTLATPGTTTSAEATGFLAFGISAVPEPSSTFILSLGLASIGVNRLRRFYRSRSLNPFVAH